MPNHHANLVCEFCHTEVRKSTLASHVKAKHTADVGVLLLDQWKNNVTSNTIQLMSAFISPKRIWIHSKMYPGSFYLFGIKPAFFADDDDHSAYIACEANMVAHGQFLDDVAKTINIYDLFAIGKEIIFTCPEKTVPLQKTITELEERLEYEREAAAAYRVRAEKELADLKEIQAMSLDDQAVPYHVLQEHYATSRRKIAELNHKCSSVVEQYEALEESLRIEYTEKSRSLSSELLGLYDSLEKQRKTSDRLESKFKRAVADGIAREQEKKKLKKAKEKAKAKKDLKRAKALANLSDSDSDSSDDSSDSDDE